MVATKVAAALATMPRASGKPATLLARSSAHAALAALKASGCLRLVARPTPSDLVALAKASKSGSARRAALCIRRPRAQMWVFSQFRA
eukprot:1179986-Alexandrium_andersonii.AAC.1